MGRFLLLGICLLTLPVLSQKIHSDFDLDVMGVLSSEEINPFWFSHNTEYRVGASSQYSGLLSWRGNYALNESSGFNAGVSLFYRDEVPDEFQRQEIYLNYTNRWLKATLGSQSHTDPTNGLSSTSKNFLFSGNARPIPGLLLEANNPIRLWNNVTIDWGIGHFLLNDDRYVEDPYLHYKRLKVGYDINANNKISLRIQHFAVWGGTSPEYGNFSDDFGAFVDVFFASQPENDPVPGEAINALGNHLGSYLLEYELNQSWGTLNLYHEHPFEDGSGSGLANFPDGIWGAYYKPTNNKIFDAILYEYVDTSNQSIDTASGADNYFSNSGYRSGWSYEGNIIGIPFVLYDRDLELGPNLSPIISNRFVAHHFGVQGSFQKFHWLLKTSFVQHLRSYKNRGQGEMAFWYSMAFLGYDLQEYGAVRIMLGLDTSDISETVAGASLGYHYSF